MVHEMGRPPAQHNAQQPSLFSLAGFAELPEPSETQLRRPSRLELEVRGLFFEVCLPPTFLTPYEARNGATSSTK